MKRVRLLLRLLVIVLVMATGMMFAISAQEEAPAPRPPWVVATGMEESALQVEVWPDQPEYVRGWPGAIHFRVFKVEDGQEVPTEAYLYLINVDPAGIASFIFPSEVDPLVNNLLKEGTIEFTVPGTAAGYAYVQAFALSEPIAAPLFVTSNAERFVADILHRIETTGISSGEWAASWNAYRVPSAVIFAGGEETGEIFVMPAEWSCQGPPIDIADVYIDNEGPKPAYKRIPWPAGRVKIRTEALGYKCFEEEARVTASEVERVCVVCEPTEVGVPQMVCPQVVNFGETLTCDASRSRGIYYEWDFDGDGKIDEEGGEEKAVVQHIYDAADGYQISLKVLYNEDTDCKGNKLSPVPKVTPCTTQSKIIVHSPYPTLSPPPNQPITLRVISGYAGYRAKETVLSSHTSALKLKFDYHYTKFPYTAMEVNHRVVDGYSRVVAHVEVDLGRGMKFTDETEYCTFNSDPDRCDGQIVVPQECELEGPIEMDLIDKDVAAWIEEHKDVVQRIYVTVDVELNVKRSYYSEEEIEVQYGVNQFELITGS